MFDYTSLDGSVRANIISFLDPRSRCNMEQVNRIVRLDVYSVYFNELPASVRHAFEACNTDNTPFTSDTGVNAKPDDASNKAIMTTRDPTVLGKVLPIPTILAKNPDVSKIWDPSRNVKSITPHFAWRCISPFVAMLSRNELQRIRKWWIALELTKHPHFLEVPAHRPMASDMATFDAHNSRSRETVRILTKCSICLDFTAITSRNKDAPYLLMCKDCAETMVFKHDALLSVWKFTSTQIDAVFPYLASPIPTKPLLHDNATALEPLSKTNHRRAIDTIRHTSDVELFLPSLPPDAGETDEDVHDGGEPLLTAAEQAADDSTAFKNGVSVALLRHRRRIAEIPPHSNNLRCFLYWDLVPLRLLSPLYVPRGAHYRKDVAARSASQAVTSTPASAPPQQSHFRKRRLFGAARASVLAAEARHKKMKLDAPNDSQEECETLSPSQGDIPISPTSSFALVPRPCKMLQNKIDAYHALPLMIYRRYVQCLCGHTEGCPETHRHWEENSSIWPRGTSMQKVEVALLRAHQLHSLIQICEYNQAADDAGTSASPSESSSPLLSKLLPVTCRLSLPGPFEPLVQVPGLNLPRFREGGVFTEGSVASPEEQLPNRIAVASGMARIRQQEYIEDTIRLCDLDGGASVEGCSAAGGACGVVSQLVTRTVCTLPRSSPYAAGLSPASNKRRLMAKFPCQEDMQSTPVSHSLTVELPRYTSAPLPNSMVTVLSNMQRSASAPSPCARSDLSPLHLNTSQAVEPSPALESTSLPSPNSLPAAMELSGDASPMPLAELQWRADAKQKDSSYDMTFDESSTPPRGALTPVLGPMRPKLIRSRRVL